MRVLRVIWIIHGSHQNQAAKSIQNVMTIGISSKNEVLRVKSLKQQILQEIEESTKFGIYGLT